MALKPITRQEQIIVGKNLEPITRMERFLKEYGGGSSSGGGGGVQPDWNQTDETAADFIKNKPFGDTPTGGDTLTWDGNTEGVTDDMVVANTVVWVSDAVINANDIPEEGILVYNAAFGGEAQISKKYLTITEDGCIICDAFVVVPYDNYDATEVLGEPIVIPKRGIYLLGGVGPISVTIPGYTGFPGVKKMDEKYLPDSVKSGAVILHVDAQPDDTYLYRDRMSSILKDESGRVTRTELENWIALGKTIYALDFAKSRYMLCVLFEGTSVITINPPKDNAWGIYNTAEYTPET